MMRSVASVLLCVALFGGFALGQNEPIVGATCVTTGPDNCVACCATKFANGVMNSDPSCATVECSPFLNQATPTAPAADAPAPATDAVPAPATDAVPAPATDAVPAPTTDAVPAPATDAVPAPATDAVPAPATDAVPAPATEAVPSPDTVIESPVIPSRPPVGEVLTDAAISPQALFGTAVAIILAVVA